LTFILIATLLFCAWVQEDIRPAFPGGTAAFSRYVSKNLKYPEVANLIGLSGKVYVNFTIEKNGSVQM
jgi:protein TonB